MPWMANVAHGAWSADEPCRPAPDRARVAGLRLLDRRPCTVRELRDRLSRRRGADAVETAIRELSDAGALGARPSNGHPLRREMHRRGRRGEPSPYRSGYGRGSAPCPRREWLRYRRELGGGGRARLEPDLRRRGVAPGLVERVPAEHYGDGDELTDLRAALAGLRRRGPVPLDLAARRRLAGRLIRRGFPAAAAVGRELERWGGE